MRAGAGSRRLPASGASSSVCPGGPELIHLEMAMAFLSRGVLAALLAAWMTASADAADRAIIVLDASGSMWGQIDGRPKVDIARETLRTVLQSVPADMELGLMAYG